MLELRKITLIDHSCLLCGQVVKREISLCKACESDLPINDHACPVCAIPIKNTQANLTCGQCIKSPPSYDYGYSVFRYEMPIVKMVSQMKFSKKLSYASILASLLAKSYAKNEAAYGIPEAILPVPLHNKRLVQRGYNQSLELSRKLSKQLRKPLLLDFIKRVTETQAQTELNKKQRRQNVKGSFEALKKSTYKHILVIDDVVTTGATINEVARVLKNSGVTTVGFLSIARAQLEKNNKEKI